MVSQTETKSGTLSGKWLYELIFICTLPEVARARQAHQIAFILYFFNRWKRNLYGNKTSLLWYTMYYCISYLGFSCSGYLRPRKGEALHERNRSLRSCFFGRSYSRSLLQ